MKFSENSRIEKKSEIYFPLPLKESKEFQGQERNEEG
jgi:hypothetical protein